ncbi:MAG: tetratricopeptide repeat protein [Nitrospinaceae bacterium]|jgi:tetratricopeptide (TPR) repeat protein|nr:tetratricopeptide repeat protein [Nitrospinaceae bacterium]MBT3822839.1 tetratricopeptide repeat protein [Nitrospinaceae bacterium]MBT4094048.1 tetratricopeptide repeat protein [Nitrospinaceae bacterium]MBT4431425.1 tetratricopeptide repeat protein [Nitrospinaceae bacterium]MBT5366489.1 tetratricopeptide repeat protein [Nitrospinaceae bacterium]
MDIERFPPESRVLVAASGAASKAHLRRAFREFQLEDVTYLEDSTEILRTGRHKKFSLILISTSLYATNAYDLFFLIRQEGKNKETPIVLLYTQGEEALAKRVSMMGANGIIERPISTEILQEVLEESLGMRIVTIADKIEEKLGADLELIDDYCDDEVAGELPISCASESSKERGFEMLEDDQCEGAEKVFLDLMKEHGDSVELYFDLAEVCFARGESDAAEEMLLKAEQIDPESRKSFMHRERSFVYRGNKKLRREKHSSAKNEFNGAIAANGKSVSGYFGLSESYRGLGDETRAEQHHKTAMSIDQRPQDFHVYNRIGISARQEKDYKKAIDAYDRSLAFDPDDPVLIYNKAVALVGMRLYKSAIANLDKALDIDPGFTEARNVRSAIIEVMVPSRKGREPINTDRPKEKPRMRKTG